MAASSRTKQEQTENWLQEQIRRFRSYPHLHRAYRYLDRNRLRDAADELRASVEIDPRDLGARVSYLNVLYRLHETNELRHQADMALREQPNNVAALLYRGLTARDEGDADTAFASFRKVYMNEAASRGDRVFAANTAAETGFAKGRLEEALAALNALSSIENGFLVQYRRGYALGMLANIGGAMQAYRAAAELAGNDREKIQAESALGYLAQKKGDIAAAIRHGQAVLERDPENLEWLKTLADIHYTQGNYPAAENMAWQAVGISNDPKDRMVLANVMAARHSFEAAAEQYARIAGETKDPRLAYEADMGLGYAQQALGRQEEARAAFARAARTGPGREARLALALVAHRPQRSGGEAQGKGLPALLKQYRKEPAPHTAASIAYLYAQDGDHAQSAAYFERALRGTDNSDWRLALAGQYADMRMPGEALAALQPLLRPGTAPELQVQALRRAGYIHSQAGNDERAIEAFAAAVGLDGADVPLRRELAYLLAGKKRHEEALEQFLLVLEKDRTVPNMLAVARMYAAMRQPETALQYYSLTEAEETAAPELATVQEEMGNLYADLENFAQAREYWIKAAAVNDSADLQLRLAQAESRLGMAQEAFARLDTLSNRDLDNEQRLALLDLYAALHEKAGNPAAAAKYASRALGLAPTAGRHYLTALQLLKTGDMRLARSHLEQAVEMEPDNTAFRQQLAYLCRELGDADTAIRLFEEVAQRDPARPIPYQDIAYAYTQAGDNDKAIAWFKRAIDDKLKARFAGSLRSYYLPSDTLAQNQRNDDDEIYAMRRQVREMARRYQFNAYQSYRPNARDQAGNAAPGFITGGAIPSQGGIEFIYQPPEIGYRDGRILKFFGRALWSNQPESLSIDSKTTQGGIGVAYKPLRDVNAYASLERLVKIGDQSENNWLLRGTWGYSDGYDMQPNVRSWNQTILYADAGYLLQREKTRSLYLEARQGRSFNFGNTTMVTPHVMLAGRGQRPDPSDTTYLEAGAGVSVRHLFNETRYEAARSSTEFILQYRKPVTGSGRAGGWVMTAVLQF